MLISRSVVWLRLVSFHQWSTTKDESVSCISMHCPVCYLMLTINPAPSDFVRFILPKPTSVDRKMFVGVMLAMMMTRMILILMMIIWYDIVSGNEHDFSNDNIFFCDNNDLAIHCHLTLDVLTCSAAGHAGSNDPAQPEPSCLNRWWRVHWGSLLNKDDFWLVVSFCCYFHPENWGRFPFWLIFFQRGWNHQLERWFELQHLVGQKSHSCRVSTRVKWIVAGVKLHTTLKRANKKWWELSTCFVCDV